MRPLHAFECEECGQVVFPARVLCPQCAQNRWREKPLVEGIAEQLTEHLGAPVASVRSDLGPVVLAPSDVRAGTRVGLWAEDGGPVAGP
jgi:uncharacterized OB-fold protein